jgi:hypothetical protein
VALDVLSTTLSVIEPTPTVLQQLTQALLFVGQLGGLDEARIEGLLAFAETPAAGQRARLSRGLAACQARAAGLTASGDPEEAPTNTTPNTVHHALGDLIRTAKLAVRESVLLLQAQEAIDYKQA